VPTDLVKAIGKTERCYSLKTRDLQTAKQRLSLQRLKLEAEFETARRKGHGSSDAATPRSEVSFLNPEEIQRLVHCWFYDLESGNLTSDTEILRDFGPLQLRELLVDLRQDETSLMDETGPSRQESNEPEWAKREVDTLLTKNGIHLAQDSKEYAFIRRLACAPDKEIPSAPNDLVRASSHADGGCPFLGESHDAVFRAFRPALHPVPKGQYLARI
jgi:hypothetical protein